MGFVYMAFGFAYMIYFTFFQKRLTADLGLSSAAAGNLFLVAGRGQHRLRVPVGHHLRPHRPGTGHRRQLLAAGGRARRSSPGGPRRAGLVISAVLFGLTAVAIPGIVGAGCGDQFGPVLASTSLGFVTIFLGIGQVLGPYLAGEMADSFGSLKYSYVLAAGVFFVGAVLAAFLRETGWAAAMRAVGRRSREDRPGRPSRPGVVTMDIRPDHAGISVGDLEASIAWYRDMLGFELVRVVDIPDAEDAGKVAWSGTATSSSSCSACPGPLRCPRSGAIRRPIF